jgi:hypothetical protein
MIDRGLFVTTQAIRRQLRAMPWELYLVRRKDAQPSHTMDGVKSRCIEG